MPQNLVVRCTLTHKLAIVLVICIATNFIVINDKYMHNVWGHKHCKNWVFHEHLLNGSLANTHSEYNTLREYSNTFSAYGYPINTKITFGVFVNTPLIICILKPTIKSMYLKNRL